MPNLENRFAIYDWEYDDLTQDWKVVNGDLVITRDPETLFSQLLKDAMECSFNSMRYVLPNWGFEGRADTYNTGDDLAKRKARLYVEEILLGLKRFWTTVRALDFTFPILPTDPNQFTVEIEIQLSDLRKTEYHKTLTWNADTKRASIA